MPIAAGLRPEKDLTGRESVAMSFESEGLVFEKVGKSDDVVMAVEEEAHVTDPRLGSKMMAGLVEDPPAWCSELEVLAGPRSTGRGGDDDAMRVLAVETAAAIVGIRVGVGLRSAFPPRISVDQVALAQSAHLTAHFGRFSIRICDSKSRIASSVQLLSRQGHISDWKFALSR